MKVKKKKYDELYNSFKLINSSDTFKKIGKKFERFLSEYFLVKKLESLIISQLGSKTLHMNGIRKSHIIKILKPYIFSFLFYILVPKKMEL